LISIILASIFFPTLSSFNFSADSLFGIKNSIPSSFLATNPPLFNSVILTSTLSPTLFF